MINPSAFAPVWAEIDLDAVSHNFNEVRRLVGPGPKIMAVIKADAYGHGIEKVAGTLKNAGADYFGVARLGEAVCLRNLGITSPILILGYTPPEAVPMLIDHDLTQTVFCKDYAVRLNEMVNEIGNSLKIHIKIDTGMGRLGLVHEELYETDEHALSNSIIKISKMPNLDPEGIYTHFAASDAADKASALNQLRLFKNVLSLVEEQGVNIRIRHAANSAAVIDLPDSYLDMVRPGIILYGLYPSNEVQHKNVDLKPAMQLKARIAQIKDVPKGFKVSYGHTYTTPGPTRLATIPLGYADGYRRQLSSAGTVLVRGRQAPVVGRVCMDQSIIDIGHIKEAEPGDEVVIIGRQEETALPAERMARDLGTINYEIVSTLMARVPRIYRDS